MRQIVVKLLYAIAGLNFFTAMTLGFLRAAPDKSKWGMMLGLVALSLVFLLAGLLVKRFHSALQDAGTVILCAAGVQFFFTLTFAILTSIDAYRERLSPQSLATYTEFLTGGLLLTVWLGLGAALLWSGITRKKQLAA